MNVRSNSPVHLVYLECRQTQLKPQVSHISGQRFTVRLFSLTLTHDCQETMKYSTTVTVQQNKIQKSVFYEAIWICLTITYKHQHMYQRTKTFQINDLISTLKKVSLAKISIDILIRETKYEEEGLGRVLPNKIYCCK